MNESCAWCGKHSPTDPPPLTWVLTAENDRVSHYCETCARENVRSIEGRLDPAYW